MKKGIVVLVLLTFIMFSPNAFSQQVGDYGSVVSGDWSSTSTWKLWDGTGFNTTASSAPSSSKNVFILSGDTVTVSSSGKTCSNLTIQAGGMLRSPNTLPTSSIIYVRIYGNSLQCDGYFGSGPTDALSIEFNNDVTLAGSGVANIARVRPYSSATGPYTFTFAMNANINYSGGSGTGGAAIYSSNGSPSAITFTINSGDTVDFAPYAYFSTSSSTSSNGSVNTTFNINGVANLTYGTMNLLINASHTSALNVSGSLFVGKELIPILAGGTPPAITVAGDGKLTVGGKADFADTSVSVNGAGTFELASGGTIYIGAATGLDPAKGPIRTSARIFNTTAKYDYSGVVAQSTGSDLPATIGRLVIDDTAGVSLTSPVRVDTTFTLSNGIFFTSGTNLLTLGPSASVSGGAAASFVSGPVSAAIASTDSSVLTFPIGKDAAYRPVTLGITQDAATLTLYTAEVFNTAPTVTSKSTGLAAVSDVRYYTVTKGAGAAVTNATMTLTYGTDDAVSDSSLLRIAEDDGAGNWTNLGGTGNASGSGNITSSMNFTTFHNFALATGVVQGPVVSTATGGNWSDGTTWVGGMVPSAGDNAVISIGSSVILDGSALTCNNLEVDSNAALEFRKDGTAAGITVNGNLMINATASFKVTSTSPAGAANSYVEHTMTIYGNLTNRGTFDMRAGSNGSGTAEGCTITFAGSKNSEISLSLSTYNKTSEEFNAITIDKTGGAMVILTGGNLYMSNNSSVGPSYLTFTSGKIMTVGSSQWVTLVTSSNGVQGASADNYVIGNFGRGFSTSAATSRRFEVGDTSGYRPLTIWASTPIASGGYVTVSVVDSNANHGSTFAGGINSVSPVRYYDATFYTGVSSTQSVNFAKFVLSYGQDDSVTAGNTNVRVAYSSDDRSTWNGITSTTPDTVGFDNLPGTITSDSLTSAQITVANEATINLALGFTPATAVTGRTSLPASFDLSQNYPNPFNPTTTIAYSVQKRSHVTIDVYDVLGSKVETLVDETKGAGEYTISFNGSRFASGVYFYRMTAGNYTSVKKLLLMK